jgi:hypothetical protein
MKTIIHVDQAAIRRNRKEGTNHPPLIVRTYQGAKRAHTIKINGPCEIKHSPHKPLKCGARVWIETECEVGIGTN